MKKKVALLLSCALTLSLALSACGGNDNPPAGSAQPSASAGEPGVVKTELVAGVDSLSTSIDPMLANFSNTTSVANHIYNTLVKYDLNNEIVGDMASDWSRPDDTTWEFTIQDGYKFHNGDDVTMEDVVFSVERCKDIPQAVQYVTGVTSVTAEGNKLIVKTETRNNKLIHDFTNIVITSQKAVTEAGDNWGQIAVGSGPYKVASFIPSNEVVLERWDEHPTLKPALSKITVRAIGDASSKYMGIEKGDLDFVDKINAGDIGRADANDKLTTIKVPSLGIFFMAVNASVAPFDNAKVREALQYTIDREALISLGSGIDAVANTMLSPALPSYNQDVKAPGLDLEKAKDMLAEAGYPDGFDTTLWIYNDSQKTYAELTQALLKEIGVNVTIEQLEFGKFLDSLDKGEHMMLFGKQTVSPYAISSLEMYYGDQNFGGGGNFGFYTNDEANALIAQGLAAMDEAEEIACAKKIQEVVAQDNPYYPISNTVDCRVVVNNLKGCEFFSNSTFSFLNAYFE